MELLKEWDYQHFEDYQKKVIMLFRDWYRQNLEYRHGQKTGSVEDIFGLPYTSSSDFAAVWNTNSEWVYKYMPDYHFRGLAISKDGWAVAYFNWSEYDFIDFYIPIGRVFNGERKRG